jgi:quercetin dioxygenase-like cupin family protein
MLNDGGRVIPPGEGLTVDNPVGGQLMFKLRGEHTNGALTALESAAAPLEGPPLHLHVNQDEVLYVLEGALRVKLDAQVSDAPAGSVVFIPRGVPHTWQNVGDAPARFLAILAPARREFERFFERYAELPEDAAGLDAFRELGREAGMEVVGPPLAQSNPF